MRAVALSCTAAAALLLVGAARISSEGGAVGASPAVRGCHAPAGMAYIPSGNALLGEDGPGAPGRRVEVRGFWIDRHEVTNRQFAAFVAATGYRTQAETSGGGAVFVSPAALQRGDDPGQWWRFVQGASWRRPNGPGSRGAPDAPVVQVAYADAAAYARWVGHSLPDEAQWERAARGGQLEPAGPGSWAYDAEGRPRANTWQGVFPVRDEGSDGHAGLAPAGCYPANAFGLVDMIGNAWEWTSRAADQPGARVVKGGSFLCSFDYCANFRPAGWQAQEMDLPTSHIGFRTVRPG